ncbi:sugar transferase [Helicobacter marmotae]|uniref:Sugar transferase n=1 Tax=Helicobacter marmotae TaxID=152490 RepID=A0A3D8I201_9HELI|nr:sugar transferase [Helicobacter marmotae]RDU59115.1 sugar transferase [Helicobacter marmotae]
MSKYAPIVLFVYNRPKHTQKVLEALSANALAKKSEIYIYQDAPKANAKPQDLQTINELKGILAELINTNPKTHHFANITLIERKTNLGLADSITQGVSEVMSTHKQAIILEDDIIVSPVFLDFLNDALQRYKDMKNVWSISAWSYPIDTKDLGDCYFWRLPHCWGWASWADRWAHYKRDIAWVEANFTKDDIDYINLGGSARYFEHFLDNAKGNIKTWAIFNYLLAYKHHALSLCPATSYVKQIGFDGSGVHCGAEGEVFNAKDINTKFPISYPSEVVESHLAYKRIQAFERALHKPFIFRTYNKLYKISQSIWHKAHYLTGGGDRR